MLWFLMTLLVLFGAAAALRRRRAYESAEDEPWRASLKEEEEPLDMDEIRRAEEEWLDDEPWSDCDEDDDWR